MDDDWGYPYDFGNPQIWRKNWKNNWKMVCFQEFLPWAAEWLQLTHEIR